MDGPDVADAGAVPRYYAQNAREHTDLLHIFDPQGTEELGFLGIARHSPSVARFFWQSILTDAPLRARHRHTKNVTLWGKADNLDVDNRSELLAAGLPKPKEVP
jgi:hypothetical protein